MIAAPIEICPVCGGHAERKISGGTGLIFKGSGFYITDYGRKGSGGAKESSSLNSHKPKSNEAPAGGTATPPASSSTETKQ